MNVSTSMETVPYSRYTRQVYVCTEAKHNIRQRLSQEILHRHHRHRSMLQGFNLEACERIDKTFQAIVPPNATVNLVEANCVIALPFHVARQVGYKGVPMKCSSGNVYRRWNDPIANNHRFVDHVGWKSRIHRYNVHYQVHDRNLNGSGTIRLPVLPDETNWMSIRRKFRVTSMQR